MNKLSHEELLARQGTIRKSQDLIPLVIVLNNIRSLYNVGSMFRTADALGAQRLWLCGITGTPDTEKQAISKTALGAEDTVDWKHSWDAQAVIKQLKNEGYEIVFLEQTSKSIPFDRYEPKGPVCLVLGSETSGVSDGLMELCDRAVEIEMTGLKNSLNVTVAFGVMGYQIRKHLKALHP